jgi:uncharacterized membrane protein YeaQ/YmgE (transglycosylase-associated protein family)
MGIILFIIMGAIAGWVASMIAGTNAEQGVLGNIVVGVLGAILGGWAANAIFGQGLSGFDIRSFLIALVGSTVLLFVYKAVRGNRISHSAHR